MKINLNELEPEVDYQSRGERSNIDNSVRSKDGRIHVYFRDLAARLESHIAEADAVLGCVAWLTHPGILLALRQTQCALVVQKEDFLRPDFGARANWKRELRTAYDSLHCELNRFEFEGNMIRSLSTFGDSSIEPVRCVGNYNRDKSPAFPRMHNKFLIFAKLPEKGGATWVEPYAVWTGSFNLTKNAAASLENALYIADEDVVDGYFKEFGQIMALSEPLDWESEWSAPEWRIGT